MIDVLGRPVSVGDHVSIATRVGNIAMHRIATVYEIDDDSLTFRVVDRGGIKPSKPINMYYHDIERAEYNKVVLLDGKSLF